MNKDLKQAISDIKKLAKEYSCHPQEVTLSHMAAGSSLSHWQIRRLGGLSSIKNAHFPIQDKDLKSIKENKVKASYINKLESQLGEKLINNEKALAVFKDFKLPSFKPYKSVGNKKISRALNVVLSDLHFGSDISKEETGGLDFGKTEEARRFARIVKEVISYKPQYRNETELNVILLGDLIQNQLHDQRDGAPLAEQICRAIHLISQALMHFSNHFPKVIIHSNSGNHARNTTRHHSRAVNQKWDSFETVIAFALKDAFKNIKNIEFKIPLTPFVSYEVFGKKIFATHGDSVLKPGFPGKGISTGSLENQINKINATLNDNDEYSVFIVGHVHTNSITNLANGATMITNGALVPSDEFAVSIGLLENSCGQFIFESVKDYPVGDMRFVRVSQKDDQDKELDSIIKKFSGL